MISKNNLFKISKKADILVDMAPMVDVVLLLIIFFMLTSTFIVQPGFKIDMPKSQTFDDETPSKIFCYITNENEVYLNDKKVALSDFNEELKFLLSPASDKFVTIKSDKNVAYGFLISIIDKINMAGAEGVNLATIPEGLEQLNIQ
jgi:biopolymer transport protein ExbD